MLLDGDDMFKLNKIKVLNNLKLDKSKIYLHDHDEKKGNLKNYKNKKIYKNFSFTRNFLMIGQKN